MGATGPPSEDLRPAVGRPLDPIDGLGLPVHPRARCPPTINRPRTLRAWCRPGHLLWPVRRPSALRPPPGPVGGVQGRWCLRGGSLIYRPIWLRDREPAIDPAAAAPGRSGGGLRRGHSLLPEATRWSARSAVKRTSSGQKSVEGGRSMMLPAVPSGVGVRAARGASRRRRAGVGHKWAKSGYVEHAVFRFPATNNHEL